jgi:putative ABC transport system permease protein
MKTLIAIAFRNLMRHKRRTILTGIIISVGLWLYIFMDSVMAGLDRGSIDNMINLTTSAVKIHTGKYDEEKESFPLKYGLKNVDKLTQWIKKDNRVSAVAPRTQFIGELSNYEESIPVIGSVVDPVGDKEVFTLTEYLDGNYFSSESAREIILGKELAKDLDVAPGDFITLYALTKYESRNADDFKIVGTFNTTDPNLNKSGVFISFKAANQFLDLENTVTEINVQLKRRINFDDLLADMKEVRAAITSQYPHLATYTFAELGAGVLELVRQKKIWGVFMTLVLLLIAAVGIVNSVLMSVYERIREVGVLRAMGFEGSEIMKMFMFEGAMIGFLGSLVGILLGIATVLVLTTYGYPLEKIYGDMYVDTSGFPMWGTIYGEWNIPLIIGSFLFGLITSILASIPPAKKAAQMEVTQAIRFI